MSASDPNGQAEQQLVSRIAELEEELRQARAEEMRYAALFDGVGYAILFARLDEESGRFIIWNSNQTAALWMGLEKKGLHGRLLNWLLPLDERGDMPKLRARLAGERRVKVETRLFRVNGDPLLVDCEFFASGEKGAMDLIVVMRDITALRQAEQERDQAMQDLKRALEDVQVLGGLLPICSNCKKIRDDSGYWNRIDSYLSSHGGARFSHSICPECWDKLYPDIPRKE